MTQFVSVVGALVVLAALAAKRLGWINPSKLGYSAANLVGATILSLVAATDRQVGFLILYAAWAAVSLWGVFAALRGREASPFRDEDFRDF